MKKNIKTFKLDDSWFKKEADAEVFKAAEKFVRALKLFSTADDGLNLSADDEQLSQSDMAALKKATALLGDVEKEGRDFALKCPSLAKAAKDGKVGQAFTNTGDALKKALPRAIQDKREEYDSYDGDATDAPLVTPEAHKAYLKRALPRLKRNPHSFAFALVSAVATDQRFLFHKMKAPRSLASSLRSDTNAKRLTFGTAAAGNLVSEERYGANTLILQLEGKMIPNLARRARLLIKGLGLSGFSNFVILSEGKEVEISDEDEPEIALADPGDDGDQDDLDDQGGDTTEAPEAPETSETQETAPPPTGDPAPEPAPPPPRRNPEEKRWLEMRRELAQKLERAVTLGHPPAKKARAVWGLARGAAGKGDYGGAIKAATMVQALLKGFDPPAEAAAEKYARMRAKILPLIAEHVKAGKPGGKQMRAVLGQAETLAGKGSHAEALQILDLLATDLARGGPQLDPVPPAPEDRSALAATLHTKADMMERSSRELAEVYPDDERGAFLEGVDEALRAARSALGDPGDTTAERDFPAAFGAFGAIDRMLREARKRGRRNSTELAELRSRIRVLDAEVKALEPRAGEPDLAAPFRAAMRARAELAAAMKRKDVYGAAARIGPWERAVETLKQAAAAQPEPV